MIMQPYRCPNFNHRRADAPVRFCPLCGAVVNEAILMKECSEEKHAISRRGGTNYCVDCGEQLIRAR
jgi:NMD protein affecting ribosome stability and mRNA decay